MFACFVCFASLLLFKYAETSAQLSDVSSSTTGRGTRNSKLQTKQRGQRKEQVFVRRVKGSVAEEAKHTDKPQNSPRPPVKEQTKPMNFRLHTEQRAERRAGFNYLVSSKISSLEILRRFEERLSKVVEEEEIRMMRKDMIPKAQLMPIFDKPFYPQRSSRPLTVPKEPKVLSK